MLIRDHIFTPDAQGRIQVLDIAKMVGLILMCYGHVPTPDGSIVAWIHAFNMPLFFIVSGLFLSPARYDIVGDIKRLLVPIVAYNLIYWLAIMAIESYEQSRLILPWVDFKLMAVGVFLCIPTWFLLTLFLLRGITSWLLRHVGAVGTIAVAVALVAVYCLVPGFDAWKLLWLSSIVLAWPFFLFGYFAREVILNHLRVNVWAFIAALAVSILALYNGYVDIRTGDYGYSIVFYFIAGIAGTYVIVGLSNIIRVPDVVLRLMTDGAICFMCMHWFFLGRVFIGDRSLRYPAVGDPIDEWHKVLFTIGTVVAMLPLLWFVRRYFPILLGSRRT